MYRPGVIRDLQLLLSDTSEDMKNQNHPGLTCKEHKYDDITDITYLWEIFHLQKHDNIEIVGNISYTFPKYNIHSVLSCMFQTFFLYGWMDMGRVNWSKKLEIADGDDTMYIKVEIYSKEHAVTNPEDDDSEPDG